VTLLRGRLALLLLFGACTDRVTAPGVCPDFCPGGTIGVKDTIFTDVIERDSAFRGCRPAGGRRQSRDFLDDLPGPDRADSG
jgi:hypothetical protein